MFNKSDYNIMPQVMAMVSECNVELTLSHQPIDVPAFFSVKTLSFSWMVLVWIILELSFILMLYGFLLPSLHELTPPVQYEGDIVVVVKRTLHQVHRLDNCTFRKFVEGFFNATKMEDIYVDNYKSLLAWMMYHKDLQQLSKKEHENVNQVFQYTVDLHPEECQHLKSGYNPAVSHCRMTLEPLPVIHRPLLLYVITNLTEAMSNLLFLQWAGFQRFEVNGMKYWYKKQMHTSCGPTDTYSSNGTEPMVFLHGISTGWMPYLSLVKALGEDRTMILVDVDAIKIKSLNFDMPTPVKFVENLNRILLMHQIDKVSIVGHSFGSITAGWFVRYFPEKVSHLTLVDPVSLLLGLPNVAYSFLYREPTTLMEWVIYLGAAREVTVAHALRRHFWWYNNALWLEDIPAHIGVVVGVSGNDEIINAAAVYEYCNNCRQHRITQSRSSLLSPTTTTTQRSSKTPVAKIETVLWDNYSHAQILLPTETQKQFVELVHRNES